MKYLLVLALLFSTTAVCAGELSDSVFFGNGKSEKAHAVVGGKTEILAARVGTVDERFTCRTLGPALKDSLHVTMRKRSGQPFTLQVQEVYPPESPGVRYTYQVEADGKLVYIRDYQGLMFGQTSYFINVDDPALMAKSRITLKFKNHKSESQFRISAVWLYSDFSGYCKTANFDVPFYLAPLLDGRKSGEDCEKEFLYLKTNLRPQPGTDVKLGCAQEIYYMNRSAEQVRDKFITLLKLARKFDMPFQPIFVSWWSGTPMHYPDGKGGKFSDPQYQQVCWSDADDYDDGEPLKKLLGDRWDIRYGFTVPNRWSNTPWLTMNHPVLNTARHKEIEKKHRVLSEVLEEQPNAGLGKYLLAVTMENEPRYWDYHCPDEKYPANRRSRNLWADFNPVTVAAAAKDGVNLDPRDGLDFKERLWLHENVARYQQETYNAHMRALKQLQMPFMNSGTDAFWHEIYSHAFIGPGYPMSELNDYHPVVEWNRLKGCRAGLEDVPKPMTGYLEKAREWGRFGQVNYEENNGIGTDLHLRTLRGFYAFGARFYNFYNWQSINKDGRWTAYVRDFCADTLTHLVTEKPAGDSASFLQAELHTFDAEIPTWCGLTNAVEVSVDQPGDYLLTAYTPEKDRILGFRRKYADAPGKLRFDLPNCISTDVYRKVHFDLQRSDSKAFGLLSGPDNTPACSLYCDSKRERTQSLMICWRADAEALIRELDRKHAAGLDTAKRLFKRGEYRKAYEEAARVEKSVHTNRVSANLGELVH